MFKFSGSLFIAKKRVNAAYSLHLCQLDLRSNLCAIVKVLFPHTECQESTLSDPPISAGAMTMLIEFTGKKK
jgi:hypothetical protein